MVMNFNPIAFIKKFIPILFISIAFLFTYGCASKTVNESQNVSMRKRQQRPPTFSEDQTGKNICPGLNH
jgi:hypothetical protein